MLLSSLQVTRFQAFLIHLGISLVIFLVLAYLIIIHWYPIPFFYSDGGWQGIRIIAAVDLVLGPLLTLIVFKPGKPGLKFDLSLIAFAQIVALTWGTWITFSQRPVAVIYTIGYFTPVTAQELKDVGLELAKLQDFGRANPVPIYVQLPEELDEQQKIYAKSLAEGKPVFLRDDLFRPFNQERRQALRVESEQYKEYLTTLAKGQQLIEEYSKKNSGKDYLFLPLHSRFHRLVSVIDPDDLKFIANKELVDIDDSLKIKP